MFFKKRVEKALGRLEDFSLFYLREALKTGLFFEQFYDWLPLYKILYPRFHDELTIFKSGVEERVRSYNGTQPAKLLQGINYPDFRRRLLLQRIPGAGWGSEGVDNYSKFSISVQVLLSLMTIDPGVIKTDDFKEPFRWIKNKWEADIYVNQGLVFKGAAFLNICQEIEEADCEIFGIRKSLMVDTFEYAEKNQFLGSWGFFFRKTDSVLFSPLMTAVVLSYLIHSGSFLSKLGVQKRLESSVDLGIFYLLKEQQEAGFWRADSLETFLKTLGWGIKCFKLFLNYGLG